MKHLYIITAVSAEQPTEKTTRSDKPQGTGKSDYKEEHSITDDESTYSGEKYPVIEQHFGKAENDYDNFSVKNTTLLTTMSP